MGDGHLTAYDFGAGPARLPAAVLARIADEASGPSPTLFEISHRGRRFDEVTERSEALLRSLLGVPDSHAVLFLQGGATGQFAAVPLNLAAPGVGGDHLVTGAWSRRAFDEAARFGPARVAADTGPGYRRLPAVWDADPGAPYLAYAVNETIHGVAFAAAPASPGVPLVADASSMILSRPLDVAAHGVIYAGAQKNLGIAGLTVVVVARDLLGRSGRAVPAVLDWQAMDGSSSRLNTPPTVAWWIALLVLEWIAEQGGAGEMARRAERRQALLYGAIDASDFYANPVHPPDRSWTTVPFTLADPAREQAFLDGAAAAGLTGLRGHRSVGGMRAALFNAMPDDGVRALVEYMAEFERTSA